MTITNPIDSTTIAARQCETLISLLKRLNPAKAALYNMARALMSIDTENHSNTDTWILAKEIHETIDAEILAQGRCVLMSLTSLKAIVEQQNDGAN